MDVRVAYFVTLLLCRGYNAAVMWHIILLHIACVIKDSKKNINYPSTLKAAVNTTCKNKADAEVLKLV